MENDARGWIWFFCILCAVNTSWSTRKYDVEHEALKLYKEDIDTVLRRFRRTPDYLKIIDANMARYMVETESMAMTTLYHYTKKLEDKVKETMSDDKTTATAVTECSSSKYFLRNRNGSRRNNDDEYSSQQSENPNMIDLLDGYKKLKSKLTVQQKNEMKNLGFKYAGDVLHKVIQNLKEVDENNPDVEPKKDSTIDGTTTHASVHEVTEESVTTTSTTEDVTRDGQSQSQPDDKTFRLRATFFKNKTLHSPCTVMLI